MQGVRIFPGNWTLLKELRLAALADSPAVLGASYDDEASLSDEDWYALTRSAAWFTVLSDDGYVGLIAGQRIDDPTVQAIATWITPAARPTEAGGILLRTLEQWVTLEGARRMVTQIGAADPAQDMFKSNGFVEEPSGETEIVLLTATLPLPPLA